MKTTTFRGQPIKLNENDNFSRTTYWRLGVWIRLVRPPEPGNRVSCSCREREREAVWAWGMIPVWLGLAARICPAPPASPPPPPRLPRPAPKLSASCPRKKQWKTHGFLTFSRTTSRTTYENSMKTTTFRGQPMKTKWKRQLFADNLWKLNENDHFSRTIYKNSINS